MIGGGHAHFTDLIKIPEKQMSFWGCDCSTICNLKSRELYNLNWILAVSRLYLIYIQYAIIKHC